MLTCTAVYISDFWAWPLLCIDLFDWLAFCTFLISAGLCKSACCDSQKAQGTRQRKLGGACSMWHAACGRVALSCERIKQNEIFHKRIATRNHKAKWFICKVLRVRPLCVCVCASVFVWAAMAPACVAPCKQKANNRLNSTRLVTATATNFPNFLTIAHSNTNTHTHSHTHTRTHVHASPHNQMCGEITCVLVLLLVLKAPLSKGWARVS